METLLTELKKLSANGLIYINNINIGSIPTSNDVNLSLQIENEKLKNENATLKKQIKTLKEKISMTNILASDKNYISKQELLKDISKQQENTKQWFKQFEEKQQEIDVLSKKLSPKKKKDECENEAIMANIDADKIKMQKVKDIEEVLAVKQRDENMKTLKIKEDLSDEELFESLLGKD